MSLSQFGGLVPDQTFHNLRPSKSVDRFLLFRNVGFTAQKCLVGDCWIGKGSPLRHRVMMTLISEAGYEM